MLDCILFVDDDVATNYLNKRLVKKLGITDRVVFCKNGKEALDYLNDPAAEGYVRPSLIFLDINMPVMDGFEFLQAYEKLSADRQASQVVVMLTTSLLDTDQQKAEGFGVAEYMDKPLTEAKLHAIISTYFAV